MAGLEKARKTHAELMALLDTVPGVKDHMESAEVKADLERYETEVNGNADTR